MQDGQETYSGMPWFRIQKAPFSSRSAARIVSLQRTSEAISMLTAGAPRDRGPAGRHRQPCTAKAGRSAGLTQAPAAAWRKNRAVRSRPGGGSCSARWIAVWSATGRFTSAANGERSRAHGSRARTFVALPVLRYGIEYCTVYCTCTVISAADSLHVILTQLLQQPACLCAAAQQQLQQRRQAAGCRMRAVPNSKIEG
eukprot:COSAG06_NODE_1844_length_8232_cov_8.488872_8_plen_198_part_00